MEKINIAQYIDHTLLKADATMDDITVLCKEAIEYDFYAVCVNACFVALAKNILQHSNVKIATTIGFPLGAMHTNAKVLEAKQAVEDGSDEIDMVMNIGLLKSGMDEEVMRDMKAVKESVGKEVVVKVIFENCLLNEDEKRKACKLAIQADVDFVKTSTGFTTGSVAAHGATKEDLVLMLDEVKGSGLKVKAAGGVKDYQTAETYIRLGIDRIGTSSGIALITDQTTEQTTANTY